jgi:hypothetical protein
MPISASEKRTLVDMEEILKENESAVEVTKPETALEKLEREKMTRRQALGRIGFLAGAAAVASLTVDELTRKVGQEMNRRASDSKVVAQVAKEFENAGIANAGTIPRPDCTECAPIIYDPVNPPLDTRSCGDIYCECRADCAGVYGHPARQNCLNNCKTVYAANCKGKFGCPDNPVDCACPPGTP